jgi:hypothetical protein
MKIIKIFGLAILALVLLFLTLWSTLALYYAGPAGLGVVLAAVYGLCGFAALVSLVLQRWQWRIAGGFLVVFAVLVIWWNTLEPTNNRDWQTDVAVLPSATVNGDLVTVHNIRNFDYRTETDYTPAWYDKTFDVNKLESVDLVAVYWMGPAIAHTFVSFGFGGGDYLAISIETRKVKGENFSLLKGFFKQDELMYIVADERDVIRLRTNYRKDPPEEVYLYRVHRPIENGRRLFLEYVSQFDALNDQPQFYNTLIHNCTTSIWLNSRVNPGHLPFSWKVLLSGYVPEYLYDDHALDTSLPFPELQRRNHVNARAHAADKAEDFSQLIRAGVVE